MGEAPGRRAGPGSRRPRAVLVAGPAGSGKSTLGAGLAVLTRAVLLDLDVLTNPLVDVVAELAGTGEDIDHPRLREPVRAARYGALLDTTDAQLRTGLDVVVVAPFTAETSTVTGWSHLARRLRTAGAGRVDLVWLDCPAPELVRRLTARGAIRDRAKVADEAAAARFVAALRAPAASALRVDALLATGLQVEQVLAALA